VKEKLLARVWRSKVLSGSELVTAGGMRLQIVHPGRVNGGSGPDFHHAIITIEGKGLVKGDIEIHVRSSQWRSHGHHQDPRYNGVILHVVMWHDQDRPTILQNGKTVPILPLYPQLKLCPEEMEGLCALLGEDLEPCRDLEVRLGAEGVAALLDKAGEERFGLKVAHFQKQLSIKEEDQVLYEGLMGALGYGKNKEPFQELAHRLPLKALKGIALMESEQRRGPVLGSALLDAARGMGEARWELSGIRPCNRPQLRIAGAGYLFARYVEKGLVLGALELVGGVDPKKGYSRPERGMMVRGDGAKYTLIGQGRAKEMVVNVLLPFSFAWGVRTSQAGLKDRALELYRGYPRLEENQVTRQMRRQLFGQGGFGVVNSAQRQQGLIHLYRNCCLEGRCHRCPLGAEVAHASLRLGATSRSQPEVRPA